MMYLRKYNESLSLGGIKQDIVEILQDLVDDKKIRIAFSESLGRFPFVMIRTSNPQEELNYSELKDYVLRVKDYLGDWYSKTKVRKHPQYEENMRFKSTKVYSNPVEDYNIVDVDEDTEIFYSLWSIVIYYGKPPYYTS